MSEVQVISQPFYLWRQWHLDFRDGDHLRLRSLGWNKHHVWNDQIVTASCPVDDLSHVAPMQDCKCGIYGYATLQDLMLSTFAGYTVDAAFGVIRCYGHIQIHDFGARVQYAQPTAIFVPPFLAHQLDLEAMKHMIDFYHASFEIIEPLRLYKFAQRNTTVYPNVDPPVVLHKFFGDLQQINTHAIFAKFQDH